MSGSRRHAGGAGRYRPPRWTTPIAGGAPSRAATRASTAASSWASRRPASTAGRSAPRAAPRRDRVRFFPSAAAAAAAGFRACRRCRPETAPGTPEWLGGSAVVARALRLIDDGFLDARARRRPRGRRARRRAPAAAAVPDPRRRAAAPRGAHAPRRAGAPAARRHRPAAGRGRRRRRATAAAASSPTAMPAAYGRSAGEPAPRPAGAPRAGGSMLRLAYRPPLDWDALLAYLAEPRDPRRRGRRGRPPTARVARRRRRDRRRRGRAGARPPRAARARDPALLCDAAGRRPRACADVFDLDCDPLARRRRARRRPAARRALLRRRPGLRMPGAWDGFEVAVRAILGQQVTVRGASDARRPAGARARRAAGGARRRADATPSRAPAALARDDLVEIGLPLGGPRPRHRRAGRGLRATGSSSGRPPTRTTTRAALVALPGIGAVDRADYVAMRALRDPDAFPAADLGLRRALAVDGRDATAREAERRAPRPGARGAPTPRSTSGRGWATTRALAAVETATAAWREARRDHRAGPAAGRAAGWCGGCVEARRGAAAHRAGVRRRPRRTSTSTTWRRWSPLGGTQHAWDEEGHPYLGDERAPARRGARARRPDARHLPRRAGAGPRARRGGAAGGAPERGMHDVEVLPAAADDPVLGPPGRAARVYQWHLDAFGLPDGRDAAGPLAGDRGAGVPPRQRAGACSSTRRSTTPSCASGSATSRTRAPRRASTRRRCAARSPSASRTR